MREAELREALRAVVERLVACFAPDQVILFGSHARGMADDESDLDLLVVMPVEGTRRQARLAVRAALGDVRTPLDILVYTPEEVTCLGGVAGHMLRSALREGRVLYDRYA